MDNCLFGAVKLTKNADPDKNGFSEYGIGFDPRSQILWTDGSWDKNVVNFSIDNSASVNFNNK